MLPIPQVLNDAIDQGKWLTALVYVLVFIIAMLLAAIVYLYKNRNKDGSTETNTQHKEIMNSLSERDNAEAKKFIELNGKLGTLEVCLKAQDEVLNSSDEILKLLKTGLLGTTESLDQLSGEVNSQTTGLRAYKQVTSERINICITILRDLQKKLYDEKSNINKL